MKVRFRENSFRLASFTEAHPRTRRQKKISKNSAPLRDKTATRSMQRQ
jgi:hypothetical protein